MKDKESGNKRPVIPVLDEIADRVKKTCAECPERKACPQRGKGLEAIIDCAIQHYKGDTI